MRSLFLLLPVFAFTSVLLASEYPRYTYAEVQVGVATSTGLQTYQDVESERVSPGSLATTLMFSGYFPIGNRYAISPTFSLLTTDGRVNDDPSPPTAFNIRMHQREVGVDALVSPGDLRKLQMGLGTSIAWWTAAEENSRPPFEGEYERGRTINGQALMARGVMHLALRNPDVSGASLKLVAAWPLTELLQVDNTAATGYVGLQCGFSMILN